MAFSGTINYRLAGNLFSNQYYLPDATAQDAVTHLAAIQIAQAALQTPDVEYVSAAVTNLAAPYDTTPVGLSVLRGTVTGQPTGPAISFLEFVFLPVGARGKTTHRVRGYACNDFTDLGVWNIESGARGDYDNNAGSPLSDTSYSGYVSVVQSLSVDRNLNELISTERVSIGAKRATTRL
jgi:hypothetical protein